MQVRGVTNFQISQGPVRGTDEPDCLIQSPIMRMGDDRIREVTIVTSKCTMTFQVDEVNMHLNVESYEYFANGWWEWLKASIKDYFNPKEEFRE